MVINRRDGNLELTLNTSRMDANLSLAHKKLNMQIVADATPYVPFQQGQLRSQVRYPDGLDGNVIEWYAPYAHYQYYGTVYTDEAGRTWVGPGETKTVNTGRPLTYHEAGTTSKWYEAAKQAHINDWKRLVQRTVGRN